MASFPMKSQKQIFSQYLINPMNIFKWQDKTGRGQTMDVRKLCEWSQNSKMAEPND